VAQTKKRRRSKHRGTAGGTVVSRGRTGRKPTEAERKTTQKLDARAKRAAKYDKPPTWKGSFQRAALATVMFVVLVVLLFRRGIVQALAVSIFILCLYAALGYYTDLFIYRRRQRKKAAATIRR